MSITSSRTGVIFTSFLVPNAFFKELVINSSLLRLASALITRFSSSTSFSSISLVFLASSVSLSRTIRIDAAFWARILSAYTASSAIRVNCSCSSKSFIFLSSLSSARLNDPKDTFPLDLEIEVSVFSVDVTISAIFFMIKTFPMHHLQH